MFSKKIADTLKELKDNYHACGVKAEFAAEASSIEEVIRLNNLANNIGLDLTVKIGGCEAVKDILDAKSIGAKTIVAPMIESPFALQKFVEASQCVFSNEELNNINLFANIESICAFDNLNAIIKSDSAKYIKGIVMGRTDMAHSLGLNCSDINSERIFDLAKIIASKTKDLGKEFIIGGGISPASIIFLKRLNVDLDKFETRKIVFDSKIINEDSCKDGIKKAIDFEIMWLKNKENYGTLTTQDLKRIKLLKTRYNMELG